MFWMNQQSDLILEKSKKPSLRLKDSKLWETPSLSLNTTKSLSELQTGL